MIPHSRHKRNVSSTAFGIGQKLGASIQCALCRRRDSNPYDGNPSADFKSATSAIPSLRLEMRCSISQIGGIGGGRHTISGQEANQAFHPQRHGHIPHNLGRELGLERETVERDAR